MSIHTILSQMEEEFDKRFSKKIKYCICCGYEECDRSTTGCPWYKDRNWTSKSDDDYSDSQINPEEVKQFFRSFATRIVEEAQREEREKIRNKLLYFRHPNGNTKLERLVCEEDKRLIKECGFSALTTLTGTIDAVIKALLSFYSTRTKLQKMKGDL